MTTSTETTLNHHTGTDEGEFGRGLAYGNAFRNQNTEDETREEMQTWMKTMGRSYSYFADGVLNGLTTNMARKDGI